MMALPRVSLRLSRRLRALLVALAVCVAAVTAAGQAAAKVLQIRDPSHVLSAEDESRLRAAVAPMPFDARLAVTSEYADPEDLSRYTRSLVTEPNMVVVAIDPEHRHVQVHFGVGSHVPRSAWPEIERAGNDAFHRGEWEQGAERIFADASRAVGSAPGESAPLVPAAPEPAARPSLLGPGLILVLVVGAVLVGLYFARRRAGSGPYDAGYPGSYGPGPYPGGYPPGQYPPQGGMGPVGGGLIGAGLGGLAGYELGKIEGERESRDRPSSWDRGGGDADNSRDGGFDGGGGGSSWDGGGSDGGGGGFDGGGGDSGSGGSDF